MKLLLENWREYIKQEVASFLPHGTVRDVKMIGSSTLSPEEQEQQDIDKYGYIQSYRDIDVEVQISDITSEEAEEWAFSDASQRLEDESNYDVQLRIVENWRQYINEMEEEVIDTLRIFDFDETIAHTRSETRVKAPDGSEATLANQQEFEDYMSHAAANEGITDFDPIDALIEKGYQIDLSDFSIVKDPTEITVITDELKQFPEYSKTYVMTARRGNSLGPILAYLDEIGVDSSKVRPIATGGESKGSVIANMIAQKKLPDGTSNIKRIEYYEDSDKNIQDVMNHVCPEKLAELTIYKVVKTENGYILQHIGC